MGSKKLKAVVARGSKVVSISDKAAMPKIIIEHIETLRIVEHLGISVIERMHSMGTSFATYDAAHSGDAPVKNWGGIGVIDLPDRNGLHHDVLALGWREGTVVGAVHYVAKQS